MEIGKKFYLETITPIAIKSNVSYTKLEYVEKENYIYICDVQKIIDKLFTKGLDVKTVVDLFTKNTNNNNLQIILKSAKITLDDIKDCVKFKIKKGDLSSDQKIDTFIRHPDGKVYIPGSSIKGALRTPMYHHLDALKLNEILQNNLEEKGLIQEKIWKRIRKFNDETNLIVTDIELEPPVETTTYRLKRIGMQERRSSSNLTIIETVELKEKKYTTDIRIKSQKNYTFDDLCKNVNKFYLTALERTISKLERIQKSVAQEELVNEMKKIKSKIEIEKDNNSLFLQIGFGCGYYSKSVMLKYEFESDTDLVKLRKKLGFCNRTFKPPFPKTFSCIEVSKKNIPLGWVKLTPVQK